MSFQDCMIELKQKSKEKEDEIELYKNKIFLTVLNNTLACQNLILTVNINISSMLVLYNYIFRFFI